VELPVLGPVVADAEYGGYRSSQLPMSVFGGATCHVVVLGYGDDEEGEEFDAVIASFLGDFLSVGSCGSVWSPPPAYQGSVSVSVWSRASWSAMESETERRTSSVTVV
jgi:hypothetical protein